MKHKEWCAVCGRDARGTSADVDEQSRRAWCCGGHVAQSVIGSRPREERTVNGEVRTAGDTCCAQSSIPVEE